MSKAEEIKNAMREKKSTPSVGYLSTGSTLLNLATSGRVDGGFAKGTYVFLVGDSSSGKTFLSLTCLAEAAKSKKFKNHRFIYNAPENGALMNIKRFFGSAVDERLEIPEPSTTIEDFYFHLDTVFKEGKPFIEILDSMDALSSDDEQEHFQSAKSAKEKGKEVGGSYGTSKAKINSSGIRQILPGLRDTGSVLIIISQTRDNIGFGAKFNPKTRSGGRALRFYAHLELWSSIRKTLTRNHNGKDRPLGILSQVEVKKNRLTGQQHTVEIPIHHSHGIDDIGSCVAFLIEEGRWGKTKRSVNAVDFDFTGTEEKLIDHIESNGLEKQLRGIVGEVWSEIETACQVRRKRRYD